MVKEITKDMTIGEILQEHGTAIAEVMFDKGMHCVGCCGASFENLEQGCKAHGMDDEQVDELVENLNKKAKELAKGKSCGCCCSHDEKCEESKEEKED